MEATVATWALALTAVVQIRKHVARAHAASNRRPSAVQKMPSTLTAAVLGGLFVAPTGNGKLPLHPLILQIWML